MPRYSKGSVNNTWDKDQDRQAELATSRHAAPLPDAELMRRFARARSLRRAYPHVDAYQADLRSLQAQLDERGLTVPEGYSSMQPSFTQVLRNAQAKLAEVS